MMAPGHAIPTATGAALAADTSNSLLSLNVPLILTGFAITVHALWLRSRAPPRDTPEHVETTTSS